MATTLIDILLLDNKISQKEAEALRSAFQASGKMEEDFLTEKVKEDDLFDAKSKYYGVPLKDVTEDYQIPDDALSQIPQEVARVYKFLPLSKAGTLLEIGMVHPQDIKASDAIKFILTNKNLNARIFLITTSQFERLFKQYSALTAEVKEVLGEFKELEDVDKEEAEKIINAVQKEQITEEAPMNKMVSAMFRHAYESRASDIHIEPVEKNTRVRFRNDGVLHTQLTLPRNVIGPLISKIKILSNLKIDETRIPQDGRFRIKISGNPVDFRVSTFPMTEGEEKAVLRLLDPSGMRTLEELGFIGYAYKIIEKGLRKPFGMILISGPTGSGKSTTLRAMLHLLNDEKINIVSLEDPVEYYIDGVNQSQIKPEIGYTFASGLRSILRQDPNVIMVGEIRDSETAGLAVHAALTGHVVLSTIHTNDAKGVIPRLVDMQVEPFLIPSSLNVVIAQRLIKKLCGFCKEEVRPEGRAKEVLEENISEMPGFIQDELKKKGEYKIFQAKGCPKCAHKGTLGRLVIFEALEMTSELKEIILKGEVGIKIDDEIKRQHMMTMRQDGILKALQGVVSLEEVLQATV